jgi:hypothetical protein
MIACREIKHKAMQQVQDYGAGNDNTTGETQLRLREYPQQDRRPPSDADCNELSYQGQHHAAAPL